MVRDRLPPLNWLRSFEAAARHLSFTAAAEELHITQSAVSQQVRHLEGFLGQPLFFRGPRSLQLSEGGRRYLPSVENAFSVLAAGTGEFLAPKQGSQLDIKANFAFSVFWLAPRLEGFLARHPEVKVNIATALWPSDFTGVPSSVEIRYGRGQWQGVQSEPLFEDRLTPVCAPAVAKRLKSPADLKGETLLHGTAMADSWDYWAKETATSALRKRGGHYVNAIAPLIEMAKRGLGVALGSMVLCEGLIAEGSLAAPFDLSIPAQDDYHLILPEGADSHPYVEAFKTWILAEV
ncbi:MAG: LysR substrate-binding domain-containing protein [Pseudomonadota bacterium]